MMKDPAISVVVCTHNPRVAILKRVISALQRQTLPTDDWELTVVDNRSTTNIADILDLSWHLRARVVREEDLGLTNARLRGFGETRAPLIILVDDDNVLGSNYLAESAVIGSQHPRLGVFGGSIVGEFETPPPEWFSSFEYDLLGVRPIDRDAWSNLPWLWESTPIGAGMVIRRDVAEAYSKAVQADQFRIALDRKGTSLMSAGDSDITITACEMGFGVGRFVGLELSHVIVSDRVQLDYLCRLAEGIGFSQAVLERSKGVVSHSGGSWRFQVLMGALDKYKLLRMPAPARSVQKAFNKGQHRGQATPVEGKRHREQV
jgi:hypothetical protein